jgi:DNA-binding transcriptional LysR family regulator
MERDIHQFYAWNAPLSLRIDGQRDLTPTLHLEDSDAWVYDNFDDDAMAHPLALLHHGIVDVWISRTAAIPDAEGHHLASIPLLGGNAGERLLVRRRFADHPRLITLRDTLSQRLAREPVEQTLL